jgi:hypothetical protein
MKRSRKLFAVCIDNTDYQASLIPRKIYEVLPDADAAKDDFIRVIDESGEDYLYHKSLFILVELPAEVEQALSTVEAQGGHASVRSVRRRLVIRG